MTGPRAGALNPRGVIAVGLLLVGCVTSTNEDASPSPPPIVAAATTPPVLPSLVTTSETFFLPDEFAPSLSYVSPDGRFVAARARDYGRVVLYRLTRPSQPSHLELTPVAEIRGFADEISWLEDSSAVLVGTDLDPTHSLQTHDSSNVGRRVAMLNTDGRVVIAPQTAWQVLPHRAHASPDGRWIWVDDRCCAQQMLLLSRDGDEIRQVVPPAPAGVSLGFTGWDRDGHLLYWEVSGQRSALVAVDLDGLERYRVPAPSDFGAVGWGILAAAPDRSWLLMEFGAGIGSSFRARRLLLGRELRSVPDQLGATQHGPFALGDEIAYVDETGTMRAFHPASGRVRDLPLRLDLSLGPNSIGISDGLFTWMEVTRGYVADLATGRRVSLPIQRTLNVSIVEGGRLAAYHLDDNAIVIFDLAAITKQ